MTSSPLPQFAPDNDYFIAVDPFTSEPYRVPRVADENIRILHMSASFKLVREAKAFATRYLHSGKSFEANVSREGRLVFWDALVWPDNTRHDYRLSLLENIEYVGGMTARLGTDFDTPRPAAILAPLYRSY